MQEKREKIVKKSGRKALPYILAGSIAFSAIGGTVAYAAYQGSFTGLYNKIMSLVFPDLEKETNDKKDSVIRQLREDVNNLNEDAKKSVSDYKDQLKENNKQQLDKYYAEKKAQAEKAQRQAITDKKNDLKKDANAQLDQAKKDIDSVIENEFNK